ncbi:MAG: hypothetical protein E7K04_05320 [Helicobacter sp.]|nr:hypothetical protein [Helicobacter sp.]
MDQNENDGILELQKIGIKKINQDTNISVSVIENILEKRFSKLQKVFTLGFIKTLEEQYSLNLESWKNEYELFLQEHGDQITKLTDISVLNKRAQKTYVKLTPTKLSRSKKPQSKLFAIIIIILVILVLIIINIPKPDEEVLDLVNKKEPPKAAQIQENHNAQISQGLENPPSQTALPENTTNAPQITDTTATTQNDFETRKIPAGEMLIIPQKQIWFQVISGKNYEEKKDRLTREGIIIKIPPENSIFIFGHKEFEIEYQDRSDKFSGGQAGHFIVKDGHLKLLKRDEYLKIIAPKSEDNANANADNSDAAAKESQ